MITQIHPEIDAVPEYDPFKDEKIINLGPNGRMTVKQALIVAYNIGVSNVIVVGECDCCNLIKIVSSEMSTEKMLMIAEKLKIAIIYREQAKGDLDEHDPEDAG